MTIITSNILYDAVGILIAVVSIFVLYCKWAYQYWKDRNLHYVEPTIPWGSLRAPHRREMSFGDEISEIYKNAKSNGRKHLGFFSMLSPSYLPTDLDIIKHVLTKDFNHFVDRGVYVNEKHEPIGAHLFAIGGQKWRNLRTKVTPTFTSGKMKTMFQTITDCGVKLEQYLLQKVSHHEPIDIKYILGNFSTDIIGSCAFGLECNSFKDPENPFRVTGNRIFNRTRFDSLRIVFSLNFPRFAQFLGFRMFDRTIEEFFTKVVTDTVNYREKNNIIRQDFLQLLIDIRNKKEGAGQQSGDGTTLTLNEIVAQCFVFFIAGFETSSTTMSFALYELAKHPEIQDEVRKEILHTLKQHNQAVTYDSLSEMKYLGQVIDETLRKYPAVPFITRECIEDYVVPDTDIKIEKGIRVFIPIKGIHYDEEYYENPEVFNPERFSEENKRNRNQYAYLPFGEGPRMCIGMRFGIMQSKVGLVSILKNFKVSLSQKTKEPLKMDLNNLVPQVEGGIWLDMEKL